MGVRHGWQEKLACFLPSVLHEADDANVDMGWQRREFTESIGESLQYWITSRCSSAHSGSVPRPGQADAA